MEAASVAVAGEGGVPIVVPNVGDHHRGLTVIRATAHGATITCN